METRDRILKAASELFLKYGLRSVAIDDICNELRISKKTFYAHFKQKDELIDSLLTEMRQKKNGNSRLVNPTDNAIDKLWRGLNAFKSDDMADKHINFFYDLQKYYPSIAQKHSQERDQQFVKNMGEALEQGIEEGFFREDTNVVAASLLMKNVLFAVTIRELREATSMNMSQIVDFLADMFMRSVGSEKGQAYFQTKRKTTK